MSVRLLLLVGDFDKSDRDVSELLQKWSDASLLNSVAWISVGDSASPRPRVKLSEDGKIRDTELFETLTSRIWTEVTVVAVRQGNLGNAESSRFEMEEKLLSVVERAFKAHKDLVFTSFTCSIAEDHGLVEDAFGNTWDFHLLQEPVARIDEAVAAQPLWDDERHLLVTLLAILAGGGFVWQYSGLLSSLNDPVSGNHRPIRVGRAYLRVVSAGRLTDEILSGAFPASGPWSIPPDVPNARAVPPGSFMSDSVVNALRDKADFRFKSWVAPKKDIAKKLGLWAGIVLFLKAYVEALKGIPRSLVGRVKGEIEDWLQKLTFGSDSSVLLTFDPAVDNLDTDDVVEAIKMLDLGAEIDAIGDSAPWVMLQQVALGAVDGGRFPADVPIPLQGSYRLVYTDPAAIGPSPSDEPFHVTDFERELLDLSETDQVIGPMNLEAARALQLRLEALRESLTAVPAVEAADASASGAHVRQDSTVIPAKQMKKPKFWQFRKKKKAKRLAQAEVARRKAEAAAAAVKAEKTETNREDNDDQDVSEIKTDELVDGDKDAPSDESLSSVPDKEFGIAKSDADTTRHKPGNPLFMKTEYIALTSFYQGDRRELAEEYQDENRVYESAVSTYKSTKGLWSINKSCDHCGTSFDHGMLYLHEPSQELVRVGHVCARTSLPMPDEADLIQRKLTALEKRWAAWLSQRSGSLLWRLGQAIISGTINARLELAAALAILFERPRIEQGAEKAQVKFGKWTRRGMFWFMMLLAAAIASVVFTPLPLLLVAISMAVSFAGLIVRLAFLARDLVRAQFRLTSMMDEYERTYARARHNLSEIVRLSSVRDQFEDWQAIIREIVHVPFGRQVGFTSGQVGIEDVPRPPAMVLGRSQPNDEQKMQLFLSARKQTIHGGWLTEIMDIAKEEWKKDYENARMTGPADNIMPEADNAHSNSVVGKRPLSDEDVYYPRTDFRRKVLSGALQQKLVMRKSEQVADDLRRTSVENLLGTVDVTGLGSALNGMKVEEFLAGLSMPSEDPIAFPPELISTAHASQRVFYPETILPPYGSLNAEAGQLQVQPGAELTAAAWRIELSHPILPLEVLEGYQSRAYEAPSPGDDPDKPSVV